MGYHHDDSHATIPSLRSESLDFETLPSRNARNIARELENYMAEGSYEYVHIYECFIAAQSAVRKSKCRIQATCSALTACKAASAKLFFAQRLAVKAALELRKRWFVESQELRNAGGRISMRPIPRIPEDPEALSAETHCQSCLERELDQQKLECTELEQRLQDAHTNFQRAWDRLQANERTKKSSYLNYDDPC